MYVFSRQFVLQGDQRQSLGWARDTAALVQKKTGLEVALWLATQGAPVGTVRAVILAERRAQLATAMQPLLGDDEYLGQEARGAEFQARPPEPGLSQIIHVAGGAFERAGVGGTVSNISAEIAVGRYADAFGWGVAVADLVAEITGMPVAFSRNVAGSFGGVQWVSMAPDAAALEEADDRLAADERYLVKLGEIGGLFVDGSGNRILANRIQ